jgi:hypothetical protein
MREKLKEFISYIAIIIPIVYIIGFVIINSYLSKYGVYDYEVVSFTYLKSSILYSFLCFTIIAIILISFPNPTDNLKKNAHEHLLFYSNFLFFCSIVTPMLFGSGIALFPKHLLSFTSIGFYSFLLYVFIRILIWRPKFSKISHFVYYTLFLSFLLIIHLLSLSQQNSVIKYFIFSFLMIGTILSLEYGDYKDGTYRIDKLAFTILMIFFAAVIYGRNVYGELPSYFGGPKNSFKEICIKDSILINDSKTDKILNRKIIYSNSTIYFIEIDDSTLLQLNRDMIKHITYKIKKP